GGCDKNSPLLSGAPRTAYSLEWGNLVPPDLTHREGWLRDGEGRGRPRPSEPAKQSELGRGPGSGVVVGAGPRLDRGDLAAVLEVAGGDRAADVGVGGAAVVLAVLEAVAGVAVQGDCLDVRADARRLGQELRVADAGVAAVAAGGVLVVALGGGDGGADVGLLGGGDGLAAEAEVGGHRDRDEDAQDDDDDQELDQGEALLARQARSDLVDHDVLLSCE